MHAGTAGGTTAERTVGWRPAWPIALAVLARAVAWFFVPEGRFASDEESYVRAGIALVTRGEQDVFWPPFTGWLIAATAWLFHTTNIRWIRIVWLAMDVASTYMVGCLAHHVARQSFGNGARAAWAATLAAGIYALYVPAIAFAQFATSETPAVVQTLGVLLLMMAAEPSLRAAGAAGMFTGTLSLTRASLLPLVGIWPAAIALQRGTPQALRRASVFAGIAVIVVGAVVIRNWRSTGMPTISTNSAYNLYIGNRAFYAEDLNLFQPRATAEQIEFRRQYFGGELAYPTASPAELQREATEWIVAHPGEFARRALGRLARVFAPKTDVLELAGGEQRAGIFSPTSLSLLAVTNIQWTVVLFGGLIGIAWLCRWQQVIGWMFVATVFGSLLLCLVAISKPRYAFVFEPLLIIGAALVLSAPRTMLRSLGARGGSIVAVISAFILWGWAAWLIFAVSSRAALANAS